MPPLHECCCARHPVPRNCNMNTWIFSAGLADGGPPPNNSTQTFALAVSSANPFAHLRKAFHHLERAQDHLADSRFGAAAFDARLAVYHATRAYIAFKTGKPSRTPRRIHTQFTCLATLAHDIPPDLQRSVSVSLRAALSLHEQNEVSQVSFTEAADAAGQAQSVITLVSTPLPTLNEQGSDFPEIRSAHG